MYHLPYFYYLYTIKARTQKKQCRILTLSSRAALFGRYYLLKYLLNFSLSASQQVSITQFAVPSAVKVGENVELQCQFELLDTDPPRSHSYLKWWWSPLNSSEEPHPIYQRIGNNPPQTTLNSSISKYNIRFTFMNCNFGPLQVIAHRGRNAVAIRDGNFLYIMSDFICNLSLQKFPPFPSLCVDLKRWKNTACNWDENVEGLPRIVKIGNWSQKVASITANLRGNRLLW